MKRIVSCLIILCIILCFCACDNNKTNGAEKNTSETSAAESEKLSIKTVENEKCRKIVEALGTMKIGEVLDDIKNINLYLEPDYGKNDYTVKTSENEGRKETDYYSGDSLVYTEYESDYEKEFANYTKTASGLDAKVTYFIDSGDNRSVSVKTDKYRIFANILDTEDPYGLGGTEIILFPESTEAPFKCSANYYYENGIATFVNAFYLEDGSYQRYNYGVDQEGNESEYTDVLVNGKAPETSDDIVKALLSDKSYKYAAIQMRYGNKWYNSGEKWYVEAELAIAMDNNKQAEEYIKKNNLKGTVEDYGSPVVKIDNAVLPIDKNAFLEDGKLPPFITGEIDESCFNKITLDGSGVITELTSSSLLCY